MLTGITVAESLDGIFKTDGKTVNGKSMVIPSLASGGEFIFTYCVNVDNVVKEGDTVLINKLSAESSEGAKAEATVSVVIKYSDNEDTTEEEPTESSEDTTKEEPTESSENTTKEEPTESSEDTTIDEPTESGDIPTESQTTGDRETTSPLPTESRTTGEPGTTNLRETTMPLPTGSESGETKTMSGPIPATGDDSLIGIWIMLLLASMTLAQVAMYNGKKQ